MPVLLSDFFQERLINCKFNNRSYIIKRVWMMLALGLDDVGDVNIVLLALLDHFTRVFLEGHDLVSTARNKDKRYTV